MKDIANIIERIIGEGAERIKNLVGDLSLSTRFVQTALMALVITFVSFFAVDIFYKAVALRLVGRTGGSVEPVAVAVPQTRGHSMSDYEVIPQRNLFATTLTAIVDKAGGLTPSEEYTAFDLKGTIAVNESMGYAIVEEKGKGNQKIYRLGEMIGSAKLIRVTRNTAVLESGGRELVMKIKETPEGGLAAGLPRPAGVDVAMSKRDVSESLGDLKSLMSQAVIRPYFNQGVQQGFIVYNVAQGSLYDRMGIKNGDIIVNVNDKKISSADDVTQLVNVIQEGGSVSVNLIRNGKNESINYSFH